MAIKVTIKGTKLLLEADLEAGVPSKTGKSLVVASTRGYLRTEAKVDGKPITIGFNAFIPVS